MSEGAPSIGNTEILTQYTDILSVIQNYYYQGVESGYISQTTTYRTFQNVLDENRVSIRNFGAVGDGITDCTTAILQAITQVYPSSQSNNPRIRRVIFFPAGTYVVNAEIALPLYATLVGDGIDATISMSIQSEQGKLNINSLYDFEKKKFVDEGKPTDRKKLCNWILIIILNYVKN